MSASTLLITQCCTCGADLKFPVGVDEVICEYCDRPNARPVSEADETAQLKYANERRNLGEFDEADQAYREVLKKNDREHEARWGHLLCKYGVMYVEDMASRERVITCRRAVNSSMRAELDFMICSEQASPIVRLSYQRDAEYIDRVQAEIRRIRAENQPYDVFLCYKETAPDGSRTRDSLLAQSICQRMETRGYRVFFAPMSLKEKSGANYEAAIFAALSDARVMLALGTRPEYFEGAWVKSEWKRYLEMIDAGEEKLLVPMYRDMEPAVALPAEFRTRYLQSLDMGDPGFMYDLEVLLKKAVLSRHATVPETRPESDPVQNKLLQAMFLLEDEAFDEGIQALKAIISTSPKCAGAHLGLCMAGFHIKYEEDLPSVDTPLKQNNSFLRALRFANAVDCARWQGYSDAQAQRFAREAEEKRRAEEAERQRIAAEKAEAERRRLEAERAEAERRRIEAERAEAERKRIEAEKAEAERRRIEAEKVEAERKRIEAILNEYIEKATAGNIDSQFDLAEVYYYGKHSVPRNKVEAARWYRAAAEQGHVRAQYILAAMYDSGDGIGQDKSEAVRWYRAAAKRGNTSAQHLLADAYYKGDGVRKDLAEAAYWYRMLADQGRADAQYMLGKMHESGEGVAKDLAEAVRWYHAAAKQGDASAQYTLALMYYNGTWLARNKLEAMHWYSAAAKQGHSLAKNKLGAMYAKGEGVTRDKSEAMHWYRAASKSASGIETIETGEIRDSWETIIKVVNNGEALDRYAVGAWKLLPLGCLGQIRMHLAGFNIEDRSDGRSWAVTTWIAMDLLDSFQVMNLKFEKERRWLGRSIEGTGTTGGWAYSEMRKYLKEVVLPEIPDTFREKLTAIQREQSFYDAYGNKSLQRTYDKLWIPDLDDLNTYYPGWTHYAMKRNCMGSTASNHWWLRSAADPEKFMCVEGNGSISARPANELCGILIGFCL